MNVLPIRNELKYPNRQKGCECDMIIYLEFYAGLYMVRIYF